MVERIEKVQRRYDIFGFVVGLLVFVGLGALEDFGTPAGGEAWIFAACAGLGAASLASTIARLRSGEGIPAHERLEVTPASYGFTVAATLGGVGVVWGIAVGPAWISALAFAAFVVGCAGRARVRLEQGRRRRHLQHDGT